MNSQQVTVVEEHTPDMTYEVSWTMIYTGKSPQDAVSQALADFDTVLRNPTEGPNIFVVRTSSSLPDDDVAFFISADEILLEDDNDEA